MKNIEKETFHWFGFRELKDQSNTIVESVKKFTYAPFVPCYLYFIFRKGWDFLTIHLSFKLIFLVYLFLSYIRSGNFWQEFTEFMSKSKITPNEIEAMKNFKNLDSAFGPMGQWRFLGSPKSLAVMNIVIYFAIFLAIMVFTGIYSRRLSWNRNQWKSIDEFNKSENKLNTIGFLFMVFYLIVFIFALYWMIGTK